MRKFILILVAFFVLGCGGNERHHMTLNDEDGFKTTFDSSKKELKIIGHDKPFILYFFSSDCGACAEQAPILENLAKEFGENVRIIGVLGDSHGLDKDIKTLKEKNISFPTATSKKSAMYLANMVGGVMGTPMSVIFDKDGKIVKQLLGLYPKSAFENELKLLL